jgi:hypothetical protein
MTIQLEIIRVWNGPSTVATVVTAHRVASKG